MSLDESDWERMYGKTPTHKMTEIDISRVLIEGDIATIMGEKYQRIIEPKTPVEEAYKEWMGEYPSTDESVDNTNDIRWRAFQIGWMKAQSKGNYDD